MYDLFSDLGEISYLLPKSLFRNKDLYEKTLSDLFTVIILSGFRYYQTVRRGDNSINETNEYSCAVTPQIRQTGNRLSGNAGTAYASLLA